LLSARLPEVGCGVELLAPAIKAVSGSLRPDMTQRFNSIESVIADLRRGRMVIVVDDADRENEGDLSRYQF
jgi:hypothetical protein